MLIERVEDSEGNVLCWYPVNGKCSETDGVRVPVPVISESIWKGQSWSTTLKFVFDGLVYGLLTAGVFGWLWPGRM